MKIQPATVDQLPLVKECAEQFYASSRFLKRFDLERFCQMWKGLLESETGTIFFLLDEDNLIAGAIGGVAYPDINSGDLIATEFFWFVKPGRRGMGIRLYRAFEQWAREKGCAQIRMIHLIDSMPDKLERVYRAFGFEPAEVHYQKEL